MFGFHKEKRRYRGQLVHEAEDEFGIIEVIDDSTCRSLHFGTREKQSSMNMKSPHSLVLTYTKAMMASLLFIDAPKNILNVGLGGGSIPKFLFHHFSEARIDVVELRELVVNVATEYFQLPRDNRINIFISDIKEYLKVSKTSHYDLIFMDVFDQKGLSDSVKGYAFVESCKNRLANGGIIVFNLWSEPSDIFKKMVYNVYKCFKKQAFLLPVADRSNNILFGINTDRVNVKKSQLQSRIQSLEPKMKIGLPTLLTELNKTPISQVLNRN